MRWKTFTIISVAVVSLIGILFVVTRTIMMENVTEIEQKTTSQSINRVLSAMSNELDALDVTTQDYATWDDTYAFIQNGNTNYIEMNLMDATFANLRLNLMLFVNTSDQVVFGKAYELNNATEVPVPQSLLSHLATNRLILRHDSVKTRVVGTILLPEGPLLVASRPILDSNQQEPIRGTLVTGRFLDSTELSFLSKTTQLPLALQSIVSSSISGDFQTANSSLSKESPVFVQSLSNERIAAYTLLDDVYGNPILILRADTPRDIYSQGLAGTFYTTVPLTVTGIAFGLLTIFLVEKFVISRLSARATGKDELSGLGERINSMLSVLGQTQEKLKEERDNARRYLDIVGVIVVALDRNGQIILLNREGCRLLGCPSEKILGKELVRQLCACKSPRPCQDSLQIVNGKRNRTRLRKSDCNTRRRRTTHRVAHHLLEKFRRKSHRHPQFRD